MYQQVFPPSMKRVEWEDKNMVISEISPFYVTLAWVSYFLWSLVMISPHCGLCISTRCSIMFFIVGLNLDFAMLSMFERVWDIGNVLSTIRKGRGSVLRFHRDCPVGMLISNLFLRTQKDGPRLAIRHPQLHLSHLRHSLPKLHC